jgi:hypothetical protein
MKSIVQKLEEVLSEFDFLFQEGVVFDSEEIKDIKSYAENIIAICEDRFLIVK